MPRQGGWAGLRDTSGHPPIVDQSGSSRDLPPLAGPKPDDEPDEGGTQAGA